MSEWALWCGAVAPYALVLGVAGVMLAVLAVVSTRVHPVPHVRHPGRSVSQDWTTDWGWVGYSVHKNGSRRRGVVIIDSLTRYVLVRYDRTNEDVWEERANLVVQALSPQVHN